MENQINLQVDSSKLQIKKQNFFIAKVSIFAGLLFAIIFVVSFIISRYAFNSITDQNIFTIIGSVALIVSIVLSVIVSFKGIRSSYFLLISMLLIFCVAFILVFSGYFSLFSNDILFYSLSFTALSLILFGIIGFLVSDKVALSLSKISWICAISYLIISVIGSLIISFSWDSKTYEVWWIILTAGLGLFIMITTIMSFYSLRKSSQFLNIVDVDNTTMNKMLLLQTFNLLSSIVIIFMYILRILGFLGLEDN